MPCWFTVIYANSPWWALIVMGDVDCPGWVVSRSCQSKNSYCYFCICFVFNPNTLYFKIVGYQFYFSPLEFEIMGFDNIGTITSKSLTFHGCWIVLKPPFTCIYKIFDSVRIMCFNSLWSNLPGILIINKLSYMLTICMHSVWS